MRAVDFLWESCYIAPQIDKGRLVVAGEGMGGLLALYACALDGRLAGAVARRVPLSYTTLLRARRPFSGERLPVRRA